MTMFYSCHPSVAGITVISIEAVTKIIKVKVFSSQYTSSDKVVDRCYHLLVIRQPTLNYLVTNKQLNSPGGVNMVIDDENIVVDVTIKLVALLESE